MSILALTSDTLIGTAAAGNLEYSSPIFTGTPVGTQRGIVPTQQYYRLNADVVGLNATSAQSVFGVGVTLSASTVYAFEYYAVFSKSAGTTSHNFGIGFGGTSTVNNVLYGGVWNTTTTSYTAGTVSSPASLDSNSTSNFNVLTAITSAGRTIYFYLRGTVSINAGGTFIPQYTLSAAPGGAYSTVAGSYFRINPLSASGAATNVGTWA